MTSTRSIGELLRRELPVPEHRDGWREGVLARIAAELATIYAENAIVEDFLINGTPPAITEGGDKAAEMSAYWGNEGMLFKSSGETLQVGPYVIQAMMYVTPDGVRGGEGVHVLKLDGDGKIAHEWASGQASDE